MFIKMLMPLPVYDGTNMSTTVLFKRNERWKEGTGRDNLTYISERTDKEKFIKITKKYENSISKRS